MTAAALIQALSDLSEVLTEPGRVAAYGIDGLIPAAVVTPTDAESVAAVLAVAARLEAAVAERKRWWDNRKTAFDPADRCNPGKLLPTPGRCAEVKKLTAS